MEAGWGEVLLYSSSISSSDDKRSSNGIEKKELTFVSEVALDEVSDDSNTSSRLPSRVCSTPASETSDTPILQQSALGCHFPVDKSLLTHFSSSSSSSNNQSLDIDVVDAALVHSSCLESKIDTATIFQAAWALLLQAYTGQDYVCYHHMIRDAVTPLLRQHHHDPAQSVADFLAQMQHQTSNSFVQDFCQVDGSFVCNTAVRISSVAVAENRGNCMGRYDLLLDLTESSLGLTAVLRYRNGLIPQWQAKRVRSTLQSILQSLVHAQSQLLSSLPILSKIDQHDIFQWNENPATTLDQCLHHAFTEKALDNPDSLAVRAWDGDLSYAELDHASTVLAGHLDKLNPPTSKPGRLVPFAFHKSKYAIITILAILKTGSACVPLDPHASPGEVQQRLQELDAKLICVSGNDIDLGAFEGQAVAVDSALLQRLFSSPPDFDSSSRRAEIAYVQYTAGTATGRPRAVKLSHAALYTGILAQGRVLGYDEESCVLQQASYTSTVSTGDIFGAFLYDACLVIPSEDGDLSQAIISQDVSHVCLPPGTAKTVQHEALLQLTSLAVAGGSLDNADLNQWCGATDVVRAYVTVETSALCTTVDQASPNASLASCIGRPFAASAWIVDARDPDRLLPVGCVGELVVGGATLASGYLDNDDDDSARNASFISPPAWALSSSSSPQGWFFRTGDLARFLDNGELELCGRASGSTPLLL